MKSLQQRRFFCVVLSSLFAGFALSNQDPFHVRTQELELYKQFGIGADISLNSLINSMNVLLRNYPTQFTS